LIIEHIDPAGRVIDSCSHDQEQKPIWCKQPEHFGTGPTLSFSAAERGLFRVIIDKKKAPEEWNPAGRPARAEIIINWMSREHITEQFAPAKNRWKDNRWSPFTISGNYGSDKMKE